MKGTGDGGIERRHHMQWTPSDVINLVAIVGLLVLAALGMAGVATIYWQKGVTTTELVMLTNGIATGILGFIGGRALSQQQPRPIPGPSTTVGSAETVIQQSPQQQTIENAGTVLQQVPEQTQDGGNNDGEVQDGGGVRG